MELDQRLEVVIKIEDDKYKAICTSFPKCKGVGDTEEEALTKLSASIGRAIARMAQLSLKNLFLSDNYTEVILDGSKDKGAQCRVFSFESTLGPQRDVSVRMNNMSQLLPGSSAEIKSEFSTDVGGFFSKGISDVDSMRLGNNMTYLGKPIQPLGKEDFMFGFPLSFN